MSGFEWFWLMLRLGLLDLETELGNSTLLRQKLFEVFDKAPTKVLLFKEWS